MKKVLIFALLFVPMASFAASSVRVLGNKTTTMGTNTAAPVAAKVTPAKAKAVTPGANTARIGAVRSTAKTAAPTKLNATGSNTNATAGSRFPVITPAHSYKTVGKPTTATTNNNQGNTQPAAAVDDPRFDMIRMSNANPRSNWEGNPLLDQRENEGYVFMWIEE